MTKVPWSNLWRSWICQPKYSEIQRHSTNVTTVATDITLYKGYVWCKEVYRWIRVSSYSSITLVITQIIEEWLETRIQLMNCALVEYSEVSTVSPRLLGWLSP